MASLGVVDKRASAGVLDTSLPGNPPACDDGSERGLRGCQRAAPAQRFRLGEIIRPRFHDRTIRKSIAFRKSSPTEGRPRALSQVARWLAGWLGPLRPPSPRPRLLPASCPRFPAVPLSPHPVAPALPPPTHLDLGQRDGSRLDGADERHVQRVHRARAGPQQDRDVHVVVGRSWSTSPQSPPRGRGRD